MKSYSTVLVIIFAMVAVIAATGCAPGSQASKQAGQGATMGAVGGAVAGAVGSLLWGGNPLQGAAQGAAIGAASGAAAGAVSGSMADNAAKEKAAKPTEDDAKLAELRQRIGDRNYATALLLAQCQHRNAIASAQETLAATHDSKERMYALFIEGVAAEESGDKALAASIYPKLVKEDSSLGSVEKLRADTLEAVMKVQAARKHYGLPPVCG